VSVVHISSLKLSSTVFFFTNFSRFYWTVSVSFQPLAEQNSAVVHFPPLHYAQHTNLALGTTFSSSSLFHSLHLPIAHTLILIETSSSSTMH
jgi:hypothetical protein